MSIVDIIIEKIAQGLILRFKGELSLDFVQKGLDKEEIPSIGGICKGDHE
ncbi:MAG: hypothetical protein IJ677_02610 [Alphaproteobacteria bacterium]|nr:hypothetical protein [Alphaproteobacteria bacterium]MBR1600451.1 hypothetical protein [Alphaproteobacteria bacterium]MBR3501675.1 hypothetical protein [Alphaproteobacteria bacterium]